MGDESAEDVAEQVIDAVEGGEAAHHGQGAPPQQMQEANDVDDSFEEGKEVSPEEHLVNRICGRVRTREGKRRCEPTV